MQILILADGRMIDSQILNLLLPLEDKCRKKHSKLTLWIYSNCRILLLARRKGRGTTSHCLCSLTGAYEGNINLLLGDFIIVYSPKYSVSGHCAY
jgi:hypothetical protein